MDRISLIKGAALAVMASAVLAFASAHAETTVTNHEAAIKACSAANPSQSVEVLSAVDDGRGIGFSLVWLYTEAGNLLMCDADDQGNVYAYSLVTSDLLQGAGPELIRPIEASFDVENPKEVAEKVCAAYLNGGGEVVASAPDGFHEYPGYVVFVRDSLGDIYLCNAISNAMIFAFEPIGDPLSFKQQES